MFKKVKNEEVIHKVLARPVIDLTDMDIWVDDYEIESEAKGWEGSWLEPAEPPTREYRINRIVLEGLDAWDKKELKEIYSLKKGDKVKVNFTFDDESENISIDVKDDGVIVKEVKNVPERNEIELVVEDLFADWSGMTPQQSYKGRESA